MEIKTTDTVLNGIITDVMRCKQEGKRAHYPVNLRKRVVRYLADTKITVKKLSIKIGLSQPTISRWLYLYGKPITKPLKDLCPTKQYEQEQEKELISFQANGIEIKCKADDVKRLLEALK